ncbi:pentapeptide repeat-containing protein [Xanthomonas sp. NCPPB 3005]|uniref:pentapeptide repeat-containing protein n=1 Tax=Xanthomonas sp. NCPPB 3005 TaxID=3240913 RepID=UPI003511034E
MKFEIKNRWTGNVQYTCELSAEIAGKSYGLQLGFAVKSAVASGADLRDADLSGAVLRDADLRGADLRGAVLSGAVLSGAVLRGAVLSGAVLSGAVLSGADLRGAVLRGAVLSGAVLSGAVLRGAVLSGADLRGAVLRGAVLRGAVLRGAVLSGADGHACPVVIKNIHQAVYAAASKPAALDMGSWHTCNTTHCRAGWVVTLAGDGGRALEYAFGTSAAAALIYMSSDPKLERMPDFYCGNDDALEDMRRLAEAEAAASEQV